jgi:hypothetical protein
MAEPKNSEATVYAFGDPSRYYAADQAKAINAGEREPTRLERRFAEFLNGHDPGLKRTVERAFRQWNGILRDYLRAETGLRLMVGEETQAVPVRVTDGLPWPIADILGVFDEKIWQLLINRAVLERGGLGLSFVQSEFGWISALEGISPSPVTSEEVSRTAVLFGLLLQAIEKLNVVSQIKGIHQDILGAYFFRRPEVHLYWMVIGFIAELRTIPVEALTFVVATHELAHAYTHLGRDIDGERWDTEAFAGADIGMVEGLAQFYTAVICKELEARFPAARQAYEALLEFQSGPYRVHEEWIKSAKAAGEAVRVSMLRCRSNRIEKLCQFSTFVGEHLDQLKRRKRATTAARSNDGR